MSRIKKIPLAAGEPAGQRIGPAHGRLFENERGEIAAGWLPERTIEALWGDIAADENAFETTGGVFRLRRSIKIAPA